MLKNRIMCWQVTDMKGVISKPKCWEVLAANAGMLTGY